ncbi:BTAD domain-containing putative transcriptional regulator [Nonomuraea sp. NPDC050643]|uniref:AfsR/SARP family transcriptional regulator n=1 Tax=Nonomuraea sp. NPDC050643 TaxID=3155660 RepID=UPI0033CB7A73
MVETGHGFRILGSVSVTIHGREILPPPQQRTVLLALLLSANTTVSVDHLADVLWGDTVPDTYRSRIRMLISKLRTACGPAGDTLIVTREPGYVLNVRPGELDADLFADLIGQARLATEESRLSQALAHYDNALALWGGPPLAGTDHSFAHAEVARLWELRVTALEERAEVMLVQGRAAEVVTDLQPVVVDHPLRERPYGQLMRALAESGRTAEALNLYHRLRDHLRTELGVEPAPQLREQHSRLLRAEQTEVPSTPRQLPPATGRLFGRQAELDRLTALAQDPGATVAIVGQAAIGKTSLALRWAHDHASLFPDGQLFLDLRGFERDSAADDPLTRLLITLGHPPQDVKADPQRQLALYRSSLAGRRMLVVLDNAADAAQVRPLLPGEPQCLTLVTSRDRLSGLVALNGAQRIALDGLTFESSLELLAATVGRDRIEGELDAAAELVRQCANLPLALRIAGARLADHPHLTVDRYLTQLTKQGRLAELRIDGDGGTAVRHGFDVSYQALPPSARRMFRLMHLVPGDGISTDAAAALAGVSVTEAESLLDALARVHLTTETGVRRFTCHDLLVEFAREAGAAEDDPAARGAATERLLEFYLYGVAAVAAVAYSRPVDLLDDPSTVSAQIVTCPEEADAWLTAEWQNVVVAIEHAARQGLNRAAWQLAHAMRTVLYRRRWLRTWLRLADLGLAAAQRDGDVLGQAAMHLSLGLAHVCTGDYRLSIEELERATVSYHTAGWRSGEADALRAAGTSLAYVGSFRLAADKTRRALRIYQTIGDRGREASSNNNLAWLLRNLGRLTEAEDCLESALATAEESGPLELEVLTLAGLGLVRQEQGRLDDALGILRRAQSTSRAAGMLYGQMVALDAIAAVHADAERHEKAFLARTEMLDLARQIKDRGHEVLALVGLARAEIGLGRPGDDRLLAAQSKAENLDHLQGRVEAALALSELAARESRYQEARAHAESALRLAAQGCVLSVGRAWLALAVADLGDQEFDRCVRHCERALRAFTDTGQRLGHARTLIVLGRAREQMGNEHGARSARRRAQAVLDEISAPPQRGILAGL